VHLHAIRKRVDAHPVAALSVIAVGQSVEDGLAQGGAGVLGAIGARHAPQLHGVQRVAHQPGLRLVELARHWPLDLLLEETLTHRRSRVLHDGDARLGKELLRVPAEQQDTRDRGRERRVGLPRRPHEQVTGR